MRSIKVSDIDESGFQKSGKMKQPYWLRDHPYEGFQYDALYDVNLLHK